MLLLPLNLDCFLWDPSVPVSSCPDQRGNFSDDLTARTGHFLVGWYDGHPAGCAGLRVLEAQAAELTRVYIRPEARGTGAGGALLAAVELAARNVLGASVIRLDTRKDLVEARGLYAKHGYTEIPAYNSGEYADHWFEKKLD